MKNGVCYLIGIKYFLLIYMVVNSSCAFTVQCPSSLQWSIRANSQCVITDGYMCLFNENGNSYNEICKSRTYFNQAGYKFVLAGNPDRRECDSGRYQPFIFSTYGMSACIFEKTYCSEEGQIIFNNGSTNTDRTCRCDYTKDYDFVTKPKHDCFCVPSMEDCSCYQKPCPNGLVLSPDYQCINLTGWNSQFTCDLILPYKQKDTNHPPNDNSLDGGEAAPGRNVSILLSLIGVTLIVTLIMVLITLLCLPKMESFKDDKKNIVRENVELKSILEGKVLPPKIRELQQNVREQWKRQFCQFAETRPFRTLALNLKEEQFLIITGPHGCGKSSLAFHIALTFEETFEYEVMITSRLDDILQFASEDKRQLFLIDDVFGKYSACENNLMFWNGQRKRIQDVLIKNKDVKLLMTSRSHFQQSLRLENLQVRCCNFNLISDELALTFEERKMVVQCYAPPSVIENLSKEIAMLYSFFPALCANVCKLDKENITEYFSLPLKYVKTELENTPKSIGLSYLALAVLIICNNNVKKDLFNEDNHTYDEMLKYLSKEIGLCTRLSKSLLFSSFISLKDSYVLENKSSFECLNVSLFKTLSLCVGPSIMNSIFLYGKTSFIIEMMQLETSIEQVSPITILIPKSLQEMYFERVLLAIDEGLHGIFKGKQHLLSEYRESYISCMKKYWVKKDLVKIIDKTTILHDVTTAGYENYVHFLLTINKKVVNQQDISGQTVLHKACTKGYLNMVEFFLKNGAHVDKLDNDKKTALYIACENEFTGIVETLLSWKASIKQKSSDLKSALHVACDKHNVKIAELLLTHKANVNQQDNYCRTPLHIACKKGFVDIIELLFKYKTEVNVYDNKGRTALFFAADRNDNTIVEGLLTLKADPNICTTDDRVPLHSACEYGSYGIAKMLLEHGARVDLHDKQGCTGLYFACNNGHVKVAELLLLKKANANKRNNFRETPILVACQTNNIDLVKLLLQYEADVNCNNRDHLTPLHVASMNNRMDIVSTLIEHGASVDEPDNNLETALYFACLKGYHSIAAELVRHDASMNKTNQNGQTPLHVACKEGNEATVKVLLNAGANVNEMDNDGMTPIQVTNKEGSDQIITMLIHAGANLTTADTNEITTLQMAYNEGKETIVKALLDSAANVNEFDTYGTPPLGGSSKSENKDIVTLMIDVGANLNDSDKDGITQLNEDFKSETNDIVTLISNTDGN